MGAVRVSEALPVASSAVALQFRMLGTFEGWRGGTPIPQDAWRTRPTLSVLKILLAARGEFRLVGNHRRQSMAGR